MYFRVGEFIREELIRNDYNIENAILINTDFQNIIFHDEDNKGIIITENIDTCSIPSNIKFYRGGLGIKYPDMKIFSISDSSSREEIEISDGHYFVFINCNNISGYLKLVQKRNVIFCYCEKKSDSERELGRDLPIPYSYIIGDKEYGRTMQTLKVYGKLEYNITLFVPTGRELVPKHDKKLRRVR